MTPPNHAIRLYELVLADGKSASPYVWRTRYALAHKGIPCEPVPVGFTGIPGIQAGRFKTVPIIEDGATSMSESWDIAEYLDRAYPDRTPLFATPAENAHARLIEAWLMAEVIRKLAGIYLLDVHDAARPEDRAYFRRTREQRVNGMSLEDFTAGREARLPQVRESLAPLRAHVSRFPFVGGAAPSYADYVAFGPFVWVSSIATIPLLAHDDTLRGWIERCFDLYGGIARDPRMRPLFE
jgi:glutathione S-transferase